MKLCRTRILFAAAALLASATFAMDRLPLPICGQVISAALTPNMEALNAAGPTLLTTERLTLKTPHRDDLPELLPIFQDGPTVKFTWFDMGEGYWNLERLAAKYDGFAATQRLGERRDFMIRRRTDGALVGRCALYGGVGPSSWEMGITLHRLYWGNGYAPEAVREILRYAFEDLQGTELRFRTEPENIRMLAIYARLQIPKVIDAADDVPEEPVFHRYHHFALGAEAWARIPRP